MPKTVLKRVQKTVHHQLTYCFELGFGQLKKIVFEKSNAPCKRPLYLQQKNNYQIYRLVLQGMSFSSKADFLRKNRSRVGHLTRKIKLKVHVKIYFVL